MKIFSNIKSSLNFYLINRKRKKAAAMVENNIKMEKSHAKILIPVCIIFLIYSISLIFPLLWVTFNSIKDKAEFFFNPWAFPIKIMFSNYLVIFEKFNIGEMFFNSIVLCLVTPFISIFVTCCAAYAVSKFNFRGRNLIYFIAIMVMFIPTTGSLAVTYKLMFDIKLFDTLLGMALLSSGGFGFNFLLMYGVFKNISWSYAEAAYVDGAGNWRIFLQIIIPHALPTITAIWVLGIIGTWNDYTGPLMFYPSHQTIATGLKFLSDNITVGEYVNDYPKLFAAIFITTLPILILFISCQKQIISLNMGGGLKG